MARPTVSLRAACPRAGVSNQCSGGWCGGGSWQRRKADGSCRAALSGCADETLTCALWRLAAAAADRFH